MKVSTTLLAFAAIVALQLASAHPLAKRSCACNLKGSDVCGSCIPSAIPRPVRPRAPVQGVQRVIYQKFAPVEFKPQDVCTCQSGLVTAPEIPRVPCKLHSVSYKGQYAVDQPFPIGGDDCGDISVNPCEDNVAQASPVRTYVIPAEQPNEEIVEEIHAPAAPAPVAADAVSLALAYDMATRSQKNILEENLAFGHMQTPKDGRIITKKRIVPESGLYAVRNQIVELKAPSGFGRSCDDEAEASLLAAQQASCVEEETSYSGSLPSYRDLGFAPVTGDCKLVPGQYNPTPNVVQTVEYTVPAPKSRPTAVYTPCDALAGIERGRGSSGTDYYARSEAQETPEAVVVSSDSDSYARDESYGPSRSVSYEREESYGPSRSGSYEREESYGPSRSGSYEREESYSPRHSGRPGCSCGCGY